MGLVVPGGVAACSAGVVAGRNRVLGGGKEKEVSEMFKPSRLPFILSAENQFLKGCLTRIVSIKRR